MSIQGTLDFKVSEPNARFKAAGKAARDMFFTEIIDGTHAMLKFYVNIKILLQAEELQTSDLFI